MDLSAEAQNATKWAQDLAPEQIPVFLDAIRQLDSLPVSIDLQISFWSHLKNLIHSNPMRRERLDGLAAYCSVTRSPQSLFVLFDRDPESLSLLLNALSISPLITQILISDPEAFELLRITKGQPITMPALLGDLVVECKHVVEESHLIRIVSRFKNRELLRIAFGQWCGDVSIRQTYRQLSTLEAVIVQTTSAFVFTKVSSKLGVPMHPSGRPARHMIFSFDGLGGQCQGYNPILRLMILAETKGRTDSNRIVSNADFFDRFALDWAELMMSPTPAAGDPSPSEFTGDPLYHVGAPVQPQHKTASWIVDTDMAFQHYDLTGRTWERELFASARCVGGDQVAAEQFLNRLSPWIYRRYVGDADIAGLGAMQRKLRRRISSQSFHRSKAVDESLAISDVEQAIRFLQLLHGHKLPRVRAANCFDAISMMYQEKIWMKSEHDIIEETYERLLETKAIHDLHADEFLEASQQSQLRKCLAESIEVSRTVIRQRLESEFPETENTAEETDLILDPHPNPGWITEVLSRHRFVHTTNAYAQLMEMSQENGHVLSTRTCRYFLSNIAPSLLATIAKTPDPDWTLANMARVTKVLGGKGILWELLSSNPAIMQLVVRICACSEYLVSLLTQSPGMIDDLLNSLLLDRLPREAEMKRMLEELCRQTTEMDVVVRDFKLAMHLQVGVRDVMAKESIVDTHHALASIAEVCLQQIIHAEYQELVRKFGKPIRDNQETHVDSTADYVVLALGRLGGREPNYHSDFTLVFLFDFDGTTRHEHSIRSGSVTSNRHFFEELAQRVMKRVNRPGPTGRLYEIDIRFGPLGESGVLAMRLDQFAASFELESSSAIQRQSLCKARPIFGSPEMSKQAEIAIQKIIQSKPLSALEQKELLESRSALEQPATLYNIKRGIGGSLDIEFIVQWLQLTCSYKYPNILAPNTLEAINRLENAALLDQSTAALLRDGYQFLHGIESALRLMNTDAKHDLPVKPVELEKLAYLLTAESGEELIKEVETIRASNRRLLKEICQVH